MSSLPDHTPARDQHRHSTRPGPPAEPPTAQPTLRGPRATEVSAARFDVDLRAGIPVVSELNQSARLAARTAGYAEGWAQGQQEARVAALAAQDQATAAEMAHQATRSAALDAAVAAVAGAATELERRVLPVASDLEDLILRTAVDLAEAMVGRELSGVGMRAADAARRAISLAPAGLPVTLRLHPEDHRTLSGPDNGAGYEFEGRPISLVADPTLAPGDAVAECGATTIDASLAAARDRVRDLLSADANDGVI